MASGNEGHDKELSNNPIIIIVGLIASCIAIFAFVTGWQSIVDIFRAIRATPTPAGVVTRAQVQRWSEVGVTDRDSVYDIIYNQIHIIPGKRQFTSGATIPAGVLITTDLGNNWSQYPVKVIARNGGWGVFETTASFKAPATGEYWLIVP